MELYKKHRPKLWKDVVGCDVAVAALRKMLKAGNVPQAILLHGPSGCGKTTLARILRKKLKVGDIDFVELNSGSYRGIDSVRDISRTCMCIPISGHRVILLDEAHKMTPDAQNALLKTLEDTPMGTTFILCTTHPEKLIKAIRTRCTDFNIPVIDEDDLGKLLDKVCVFEKIKMVSGCRDRIIDVSAGSARSMLVLLNVLSHTHVDKWDDAISAGALESESPETILLCRALMNKAPWKAVAKLIKGIDAEPESVRWAVLGYARVVLLSSGRKHAAFIIDCFSENFYNTKQAGLVAACYEVICGN